jgi:hypothetical protein
MKMAEARADMAFTRARENLNRHTCELCEAGRDCPVLVRLQTRHDVALAALRAARARALGSQTRRLPGDRPIQLP